MARVTISVVERSFETKKYKIIKFNKIRLTKCLVNFFKYNVVILNKEAFMNQIYKVKCWKDIIKVAERNYVDNGNLHAYAKEIVRIGSSALLSSRDVLELALHIGIKVFPKDRLFHNFLENSKQVITGLPNTWNACLCSEYFSLAYRNPHDPFEFIAIVPSSNGGLPYIIHHTSEGFVDPNWFNEIVPVLYTLSCSDNPQRKIGSTFNSKNLTLGQINTILHYFKADPILKIMGICLKCYQVSFPKKGFGVKYSYMGQLKEIPPNGIIKEIRFSARKSLSNFEGSKKPYVTELIIASNGMKVETLNGCLKETKEGDQIWTMHNPHSGHYEFSTHNERDEVHIDAKLYDYDKLTMRLPVCLCTQ